VIFNLKSRMLHQMELRDLTLKLKKIKVNIKTLLENKKSIPV